MSAPDLSGDLVRELVKWIRLYGSAEKLLREHAPRRGRCPTCRSKGCTLYTAAVLAAKLGGSKGG